MDELAEGPGICFGGRNTIDLVSTGGGGNKEVEEVQGSGSSLSDESLALQLNRCKTQSSVYLTLSKKLRVHQVYAMGDIRLYTSLTDASRCIQQMCEKNPEAQDAVRAFGLLNTIVEALVFFFQKHLENHANPLSQDSLVKCWSNLCTALIEAVGNPTHKLNQQHVLGKLIEKHDLAMIRFLVTSSKSVEKKTEKYVIPLVQLFRTLLIDNSVVKRLVLSRDYFIINVAEGLKSRLIMSKYDDDQMTWKSIDLMGWILYMILQQDVAEDDDKQSKEAESINISCINSASDAGRILADLVIPCLTFLEKNSDSEKTQSIGIISFLATILSRDLETAQRFIASKGEIIFAQILSSDPQSSVKKATEYVFKVLKVQKKKMRGNGIDNFTGEDRLETQSNLTLLSSAPRSELQTNKADASKCTNTVKKKVTPAPSTPSYLQVRSWIEKSPFNVEESGQGSSSGNSSFLPVPTSSEIGTSVSRCKGRLAAPRFRIDHCCPTTCERNQNTHIMSSLKPVMYETEGGCGLCLSKENPYGRPQTLSPIRNDPIVSLDEVSFRFEDFAHPPMYPTHLQGTRKRACSNMSHIKDIDRKSCISIKIPRTVRHDGLTSVNTTVTSVGAGESSSSKITIKEASIGSDELSKMLSDLRPCDVMENDDHVVIFCTPPHQPKHEPNEEIRTVKKSRKSVKPVTKRKARQGIMGKLFYWLFG